MGFSLKELIRAIALTRLLPASPQPPLPAAFPSPLGCLLRGHTAFTALPVLLGCPTTRRASLPTSSLTYRVAYPDATQEPGESSWGHTQIFRTVPPAHTLVRWVDELRLRLHSAGSTLPHLWPTGSSWDLSLDCSPVLLLMPFGFHLAVDTLPSGGLGYSSACSHCL